VTFTAAEKTQLEQAFPTGVCDYSKAGVGFRKPIAPWLSYGDSPTSVTGPFPLPPVSARGLARRCCSRRSFLPRVCELR
jgi:Tannase-like family of unknown function (DUF6351)